MRAVPRLHPQPTKGGREEGEAATPSSGLCPEHHRGGMGLSQGHSKRVGVNDGAIPSESL